MKSDWHLPWGGILAALAVMSCSQQHAPSPTASAPPPAPASMAPMASAPGAPASLADWARGAIGPAMRHLPVGCRAYCRSQLQSVKDDATQRRRVA